MRIKTAKSHVLDCGAKNVIASEKEANLVGRLEQADKNH